jgi:protein-tyrosine phosphatase
MLREVQLDQLPGCLFLTGMPGRYNSFASDVQAILTGRIDTVLALASVDETRRKSPEYSEAILSGKLPFSRKEFSIPDYGVPADKSAYLRVVQEAAANLQAGKNILIHCGAGIGRTGTLAASILTAFGYSVTEALSRVEEAGSGPETPEQRDLIEWISAQS